ncbi:MAG: DUF72 domain-containing protein [Desulfurococcaceae archaeon]
MEIYVGTSGWLYEWNEEGTLDWYVRESGLNAVELNASFYRFPFRNQVSSWARKGSSLRWAIKAHRSMTHTRKLGPGALGVWAKFRDLMAPMDNIVDFYLFQLPPTFSCKQENLDRAAEFHAATGLGRRFAIEFRHESCFSDRVARWAEENGLVAVSVDSPMGTWIVSSGGAVYLRLHGRSSWYGHEYSREELVELASRIASLEPEKVYAFFNNDHWMLENARTMRGLLEELGGRR